VKNGLITDTTISNLAFFDGNNWITPKTPLLKGTKREELIQKGFLKEKEIKIEDIKHFKKFAMMNAIIGFYEKDITCITL
ncbi:MAG: 4-amino-4-deoxychorismate lyase, partial [Nautilia sp.]